MISTGDGTIRMYDFLSGERVPIHDRGAVPELVAAAYPWVVGATGTTVWRRNVVTGVEQTAHLSAAPTTLAIATDGTAYYPLDRALHVWRADGTVAIGPATPLEFDRVAWVDADHMFALRRDGAGYLVDASDREHVTIAGRLAPGAHVIDVGGGFVLTRSADGRRIGIIEPVANIEWTLARMSATLGPIALPFTADRVYAQSNSDLLAWSLRFPTTWFAMAPWLDELTNASAPTGPETLAWQ